MILCIMKDITKERKHKDQIHNAQIEAARMADKLVEEQLKIVQQIAGLLWRNCCGHQSGSRKTEKIPYFWRVKKRMKKKISIMD